MISRDACLQLDTQNSLGASGHVLESLLARDRPALFENSKNLASSSSCILKPIDTGKNCESKRGVEKRTSELCNTNSSLCQEVFDLESSISCRRHLSSKLYDWDAEESKFQNCIFEKFSDTSDFQCWKTNFKTEV